MSIPAPLHDLVRRHGQEHLLRFWDRLTGDQQAALRKQIEDIDFALLQRLSALRDAAKGASAGHDDRAARATSPQRLLRLPTSDEQRAERACAAEAGNELLQQGKVGAILVAGGQGSRLGFDDPKGMFPIGPVSGRMLFRVLCEQVLARSKRAGKPIPYFIMTSEATHARTVACFEQHRYFGLPEEDVYFFQQSSLPAIEDKSHRLLLEFPWRIAASPDGHGGMLRALQRGGLLDVMRDRGIEHLYYHQVDNPTAIVCDPALLGDHVTSRSDLTTKVVAKVSPEEKMGVLVDVDRQTQIIEYSDLPAAEAHRKTLDGNYVFWAGNTAIHVFRRKFLERLLESETSLPFHIAHKKVPSVDEAGRPADPAGPNAHKFEQFIFDALPHAEVALVVEADRAREFNPVKNATGADSPATSRAALAELARHWIAAAGGRVAPGTVVEISPLYALDAAELRRKLPNGATFNEPTVLE